MFYSKSTGGFYTAEIHGANIPADVVEITTEEHAALMEGQSQGKLIGFDEAGRPVLQDQPPPAPFVPAYVTMRQARLALLAAGLLDDVEVALAAMEGMAGQAAKIEWDYSSEVHRNKEFVQMIAQQLDLSDAQLDQMFIEASQL